MKALVLAFVLISLLSNCQDERSAVSAGIDLTTNLVGTYKLTYASYFGKDVSTNYTTGSLTMTRLDATTAKGDVILGSPSDRGYNQSTSKWSLTKLDVDSVQLGSDGYYSHGKVFLSVADGSLHLRFIKQ